MNALSQFARCGDKMDRIEGNARETGHLQLLDLIFYLDRAGNDQTDSTLGTFNVVVDDSLLEAPIGCDHSKSGHGGHGNPVLYGASTNGNRCEHHS